MDQGVDYGQMVNLYVWIGTGLVDNDLDYVMETLSN